MRLRSANAQTLLAVLVAMAIFALAAYGITLHNLIDIAFAAIMISALAIPTALAVRAAYRQLMQPFRTREEGDDGWVRDGNRMARRGYEDTLEWEDQPVPGGRPRPIWLEQIRSIITRSSYEPEDLEELLDELQELGHPDTWIEPSWQPAARLLHRRGASLHWLHNSFLQELKRIGHPAGTYPSNYSKLKAACSKEHEHAQPR